MKFDRLMEQLLGVLAVLTLTAGTLIVVGPFITALIWGAILAYCTWQPFKWLAAAFGGRSVWATLVVVALILLGLLGPILYAGVAFSTRVPELAAMLQDRLVAGMAPLPDWVTQVPVVGERLEKAWEGIVSQNPEVMARLKELAGPMLKAALAAGLSVMSGLGLLVLSILFAAYFYVSGESAAAGLRAVMRHIAGARADELLMLVGGTIKGVVYGILGTSLVQAILCAVGYWIAGLPSPALLGLLTFFLAIIPGGPLLVVVPGALWLAQTGHSTWAIFIVVWAAAVGISVDNVLKPILIGKSSHVPFILVMLGVIGGAAAFGLLGVFVGPTLLAVTHAVLRDWVAVSVVEQPSARAAAAAREAASQVAMNRHEGLDISEGKHHEA